MIYLVYILLNQYFYFLNFLCFINLLLLICKTHDLAQRRGLHSIFNFFFFNSYPTVTFLHVPYSCSQKMPLLIIALESGNSLKNTANIIIIMVSSTVSHVHMKLLFSSCTKKKYRNINICN